MASLCEDWHISQADRSTSKTQSIHGNIFQSYTLIKSSLRRDLWDTFLFDIIHLVLTWQKTQVNLSYI